MDREQGNGDRLEGNYSQQEGILQHKCIYIACYIDWVLDVLTRNSRGNRKATTRSNQDTSLTLTLNKELGIESCASTGHSTP